MTTGRVADRDPRARDVEHRVDVGERVGEAGAPVLDVPRRPAVQCQLDRERTSVRAGERRAPEAAVNDDRVACSATPHIDDLVGVVAVGDRLEARVALLRPGRKLGEEGVEIHGRSL